MLPSRKNLPPNVSVGGQLVRGKIYYFLIGHQKIHRLITFCRRYQVNHLFCESKPASWCLEILVGEKPVVEGAAAAEPIALSVKS